MTMLAYSISREATYVIVQALVSKSEFEIDAHANLFYEIRKEAIKTKNQLFEEKYCCILIKLVQRPKNRFSS